MSEMTMLEKIAQAINECDDGRVGFCERAAEAVLKAMREPTEAMIAAANAVSDLLDDVEYDPYEAGGRWRTMINAALNDTPPAASD